jgi:branched-chain amino acid transport system permease protein
MSDFLASYDNVIALVLLNGIVGIAAYLMLIVNRFSLATGGLMAVGAYVSVLATTQLDWPFGLTLLAAGAAAAIVALVLGLPTLRIEGDYFALVTLAFTEIIRIIVLNWESVTGGALGIVGIPTKTETWQLALAVIVLAIAVYAVRRSWIGRVIDAIRLDEMPAQAIGIDVARVRLILFVISGAICGVAGGFAGHLNYFIGPSDFGMLRSVDAVVYAVFGGLGSIFGPILGALVYTVLPEALRFSAQAREIALALVIILAVLFLPRGLISLGGVLRGGLRLRVRRPEPLTLTEKGVPAE